MTCTGGSCPFLKTFLETTNIDDKSSALTQVLVARVLARMIKASVSPTFSAGTLLVVTVLRSSQRLCLSFLSLLAFGWSTDAVVNPLSRSVPTRNTDCCTSFVCASECFCSRAR